MACGLCPTILRVWDIFTGAKLIVFKGHSDWVNSVAISKDGTQIVSGSFDRNALRGHTG